MLHFCEQNFIAKKKLDLIWWVTFLIHRFIRMEYEPVFGLDNICKRFDDASHNENNHFVEGLQYSLDEAVLMTAVMVPDHEVDHKNVK